MDMLINTKYFVIEIYGDGEHEYDGYYNVVMFQFDDDNKPTGNKKRFYIKCPFALIEKFVTECCDTLWEYKDNTRMTVEKTWSVKTQTLSKGGAL